MERKRALVTGASKGIGRGIAYGLAEEGWSVGINFFRDEEGAEETLLEVERRGGNGLLLDGDVGEASDVERVCQRVVEAFGGMDLLVNNAGRQTWKPLLELTEEDFDRTLRTNLKGTFLATQQAARQMVKQGTGGLIVNIGSASNKHPFPNLADYTASKGGVEQLTKVSAVELGPHGIRVNCVAPGAIEIERTKEEAPEYGEIWSALTPLGRVGVPKDIAGVVTFLAREEASYVTGQTIYVDGGTFTKPQWPY
ncbi:MAG: 3-oxoacyl-ACP reductase family protein [Verrucomicrobiota bacterium]